MALLYSATSAFFIFPVTRSYPACYGNSSEGRPSEGRATISRHALVNPVWPVIRLSFHCPAGDVPCCLHAHNCTVGHIVPFQWPRERAGGHRAREPARAVRRTDAMDVSRLRRRRSIVLAAIQSAEPVRNLCRIRHEPTLSHHDRGEPHGKRLIFDNSKAAMRPACSSPKIRTSVTVSITPSSTELTKSIRA